MQHKEKSCCFWKSRLYFLFKNCPLLLSCSKYFQIWLRVPISFPISFPLFPHSHFLFWDPKYHCVLEGYVQNMSVLFKLITVKILRDNYYESLKLRQTCKEYFKPFLEKNNIIQGPHFPSFSSLSFFFSSLSYGRSRKHQLNSSFFCLSSTTLQLTSLKISFFTRAEVVFFSCRLGSLLAALLKTSEIKKC